MYDYEPRPSVYVCKNGVIRGPRAKALHINLASFAVAHKRKEGFGTAKRKVSPLVLNARLPQQNPAWEYALRMLGTTEVVDEPLIRSSGIVFALDRQVEAELRQRFGKFFDGNTRYPRLVCFDIEDRYRNPYNSELADRLTKGIVPFIPAFIRSNRHLLLQPSCA